MQSLILLVLTVVGARTAARGTMTRALGAVIAFVVLVPDTLALPGFNASYLPVRRLVLAVMCVRLARDALRGDIWRVDLRPSRVHLAFAAYVVAVLGAGLLFAPANLPAQPAVVAFATVLEAVMLFTVVLVACRVVDDPPAVVRLFAIVVATSVVIAALEKLTGLSWATWLLGADAQGLETRGGAVRVRAGAQFPLAFAWITAVLSPFLVVHAARARRLRWWALTALGAATVVWSGSRSALPGLAVALVVVVVAARFERRFVIATAVAGLVGVAAVAGIPGVTRAYSAREAAGSDETRVGRLAIVTEAAAERPITGLGLSAVSSVMGIYGTDASYLLAYVETGVVGLTTLSVLLLTALLCAAGGLRAPPGADRRAASAVVAAMVLGVAGAAAFDLFTVPGAAMTFWAVCAFGVSLSDRVRPFELAVANPSPYRLLLPVAGLALGLFIAGTAPRHAAVDFRFETVPVAWVAHARTDLSHFGNVTATTTCEHIDHIDVGPDVDVRCRVIDQSGGLGALRVEAPDAEWAAELGQALVDRLERSNLAFRASAVGPPVTGRPTIAATAPVWLALGGLLLALLLPPPAVARPIDPRRRAEPTPVLP